MGEGLRLVHHTPRLDGILLRLLWRWLVVWGLIEVLLREIGMLGVGHHRGMRWVRLVLLLFLSDTNAATSFPDETFMLAAGEERQAHGSVLAAVLVMVPETIHVFVSPPAVSDSASVRSETFLHFPHFAFAHALLDHFTLFTGGKITRTVGHVVLQAVRLLVRFIAIWFGAFELLGDHERVPGTGERSGGHGLRS